MRLCEQASWPSRHVGLWHLFPFDGWRHGRSTPKGDLYAKGENDPIQNSAAHHHCDATFSFGWERNRVAFGEAIDDSLLRIVDAVAAPQPVRSFRQARPSQSFYILCRVFRPPGWAQYTFEGGNT